MKQPSKHSEHHSIVQELAMEAIRGGADMIEVEYEEGYEEVYIRKDNLALGIDRIKTSSPDAAFLRRELYGLAKRSGESLLTMKSTSCAHVSMTALVTMRSESSCENSSVDR
jgi:hypothetical protein